MIDLKRFVRGYTLIIAGFIIILIVLLMFHSLLLFMLWGLETYGEIALAVYFGTLMLILSIPFAYDLGAKK